MLARFILQFPGSKHIIEHRIDTHKLNDHEIRENYQLKISEKLETERSNDPNEQWDTIRDATKSSAEEFCGAPTRQLDPRISQNSLNLIHQRRELPPGSPSTIKRRQMSRQIRRSLRLDRENWWIQKAEMETAIA